MASPACRACRLHELSIYKEIQSLCPEHAKILQTRKNDVAKSMRAYLATLDALVTAHQDISNKTAQLAYVTLMDFSQQKEHQLERAKQKIEQVFQYVENLEALAAEQKRVYDKACDLILSQKL